MTWLLLLLLLLWMVVRSTPPAPTLPAAPLLHPAAAPHEDSTTTAWQQLQQVSTARQKPGCHAAASILFGCADFTSHLRSAVSSPTCRATGLGKGVKDSTCSAVTAGLRGNSSSSSMKRGVRAGGERRWLVAGQRGSVLASSLYTRAAAVSREELTSMLASVLCA